MTFARGAWVAVVVIIAAATGVQAAISWSTTSTTTTSVTPPPVQLELGNGANKTHYFSPPLTLSANGTLVSGTLSAKAGADARVKNVLKIANRDAALQNVTLTATQVTNANVEAFTWSVYDGNTLVGILDLKSATPSLAFALPAAATYRLDLRIDIADGAGKDNSPTSFDLSERVG